MSFFLFPTTYQRAIHYEVYIHSIYIQPVPLASLVTFVCSVCQLFLKAAYSTTVVPRTTGETQLNM